MAAAGADIVVAPHGPDHRRRDRRRHGAEAGRLRGADQRLGGGRQVGEARRDRAVPRRPDRHAARTRSWILARCPDCHGFYGASSMERLPTEVALTETTRRFMQITTIETKETHHDRRPIRHLHPRPDRRRDRRRDRRLAAALAVPAQQQGARVRAHRPRRPEGGARRRRVRAADRARGDPGQHEHAAAGGGARPRQGADHQGPHARRRDRRVLRARGGRSRGGGRGGADARPAHAGARAAEGAGRRQVRRRAAHRGRRDDDGGAAREARRLRASACARRWPAT